MPDLVAAVWYFTESGHVYGLYTDNQSYEAATRCAFTVRGARSGALNVHALKGLAHTDQWFIGD